MAHTCSTALLRCIDFRLEPATSEYLQSKNLLGDTDIISVAGAAKDIAQSDESYPEHQIDLSAQLHSINTLMIMHHSDCGAYGGSAEAGSPEEEKEMHVAEMSKAKAKILAKHPDLNIVLLYAHINTENMVTLMEEIV